MHVYTSPHLVRFHERIRLAGELIDEDALLAALDECERANRRRADHLFRDHDRRGLSRLLRAPRPTSCCSKSGSAAGSTRPTSIRRPAVTAITPISLDHQAFLGDTVAAIAGEKAGILKPGVPAVIGPQPDAAAAVIEARAAAIGAPLYRWRDGAHPPRRVALRCGEAARGGEGECGMHYEGERWRLDLPLPSLPGAHQIANAGIALACLERLDGFSLPRNRDRGGSAPYRLAGAAAAPDAGPLVETLPPGWELWLDGGHNPGAGQVLAEAAPAWRDRPLYLVVGMLNTKDASGFSRAARAARAGALRADDPRRGECAARRPHRRSCARARDRSRGNRVGRDRAALYCRPGACRREAGPARVLICGSLHLAGIVLAENG